ncbi:MAG: hypothetical protein JO304_27025 [Solirubrobacterales bacterium]|nr:hypothetical protein [Solirubrobacterales bacterium]
MSPEHLDYRSRSPAARTRDAALARVGRTRRWVIAGAAALTAGIAGLVSAVAPGRSLASKSHVPAATARSSPSGSTIPPLPPVASAGDLGLQGPGQAPSAPDQSQPQSVPSQPPPAAAPPSSGGGGGVVSGGS